MFQNNIYPGLTGLSQAGRPIRLRPEARRSPTLSRRELRRLIADMID
jgi:hypothetical protein